MRSFLSQYNQLSVSLLAKETAINTEQTLSHTLMVASGDILGLEPRRETNADEQTGKEEADSIYDLGSLSNLSLNFDKAKPQDFLLAYAYGLGSPVVVAAGSTGYKHTLSPLVSPIMPSFTVAQRLGSTIAKRRMASMFVDQITSTFAKDAWAKLVASCKGTGKYATNVTREQVTAAYNATTFTLAANGVQGSAAADRIDSVHQIRVLVPTTGEWVEVTPTIVSAATPAVITFAAPGGVATSTTYEILYVPIEPAWCTFPARVIESPLRVTDLVMKVGGKWSGTAFLGGRTLSQELTSIEHSFNNNMAVEYRVGGTGTYASYALRKGREQSIKLNREMREYILQQRMMDTDYFGVYAKATGALYEAGQNYSVEMIFPRCAVLKAPISVGDKVVAEAGDLSVLQDDTYSSIIVNIQNKIATAGA
jgi:hypothetical protein